MSKSAALFGGPQQQPQAKHLLQFRAGKMTMDSEKWVHADPRKGWVYVYQSGDGKLHFCWIDRKTRLVEDNFVIDAKQAEFKKVPQCTTGRVYLLKFKNNQRFFVWMQEPNKKNDSTICSRINDFITCPPSQLSTPGDLLSGFEGFSQLSQSDLLALLSMSVGLGSGLSSESDVSSAQATAVTIGRHLNTGHLEGQGKTSTAGARAGTLTTSSNASKPGEKGKIQLQDLRNILSSISSKPSEPKADLSDSLNLNAVRDLLQRPDVQSRLLPHLPVVDESQPVSDVLSSLITNIQSSEFASTIKSFSAAFHTGALAPALSQFQLGEKAVDAAKRGDLLAFAQALQSTSASQPSIQPTGEAQSSSSNAHMPPVSEGMEQESTKDQGREEEKPDETDESPMETD